MISTGTSYHGHNIKTTIDRLCELSEDRLEFRVEQLSLEDEDDKVQAEFSFTWEDEDGEETSVFIYSWKEYRELDPNEIIHFHIGSRYNFESSEAARRIENILSEQDWRIESILSERD